MNNFDIFGHGEAISEAKNCLSEIVEIIDNRVQLVCHALQYFYNNSNSQTMRWGLEKRQEKLLNAKDSIHFYFMKILTEIENCVTLTSDRNADSLSASDGVLRCLADVFGTTVNNKGYQVLNDKVGIIYGGGINHEQYMEILTAMQANHFASSNLVVGVGGDVLQQQIRDDIGFSFKTTNVVVNGKSRMSEKCATEQTTSGCYSGKVMLVKGDNGYSTLDQEEYDGYMQNELKLSYMDCKILIEQTVDQIRSRVL